MWAMELSSRPPLYLVPRPREACPDGGTSLPHATVWAHLAAPGWDEQLELHLQLVAERHDDVWEWRRIDLSRRPLASKPVGGLRFPASREIPDRALRSLREWLARHRLTLYRSREVGMTSAPGEPRDSFRRRVLAEASEPVRASLQRGVWGREAGAAALSELAGGIEAVELALESAKPLRVAVGLLVVPSLRALEEVSSGELDLMVHGRVRGASRRPGVDS